MSIVRRLATGLPSSVLLAGIVPAFASPAAFAPPPPGQIAILVFEDVQLIDFSGPFAVDRTASGRYLVRRATARIP